MILKNMRARIVSAEESVDVVAASARRVADDVQAIRLVALVALVVVALTCAVVILDGASASA